MHLSRLRIENLALVDSLDVEFTPGGTAVTGETGAGKSMILGSLQLLMGCRADATMVRKGARRAVVEGVFESSAPVDPRERKWKQQLRRLGFDIDDDEPIILRREVAEGGRGVAQVAGRLVTVRQLAEVADDLVDIHSQHDQQSLVRRAWQRHALDTFARAEKLAKQVDEQYRDWSAARAAHEKWTSRERELRRQEDLLRFQLNEINDAKLRVEEEKLLTERENVLAHAEEIGCAGARLLSLLQDEQHGVITKLQHAQREIQHIQQMDAKAKEWSESVSQALIGLSDLEQQLGSYRESLEANPAELVSVQDRLHTISQLKKKYGDSIGEVLQFAEEAESKLQGIDSFDERVAELKKQVDAAKKRLDDSARKLSAKRRAAAKKLNVKVEKELARLGMKGAKFVVSLQPCAEVTAAGAEDVEFHIAVNPGEDPKPLNKVASGGELSRITLALKCIATSSDDVPILVFDEIDAGVSGTVAHAVGKRLQKLATDHQVFVITHLPQIACRSRAHFSVKKASSGKRTVVKITALSDSAREKEIARMLGGESETALAHAREMFARARAEQVKGET